MKKRMNQIVLMLAVGSILVVSCDLFKKDEPEQEDVLELNNEFMYKDQRYPLAWGFYMDYGRDGNFTNFDLIITQVEENLEEVNDEEDLVSDYYLYFWLESEADEFSEGVYTYDPEGYTNDNGSFLYSGDIWFRDQGEEIGIKSGSLEIKTSGSDYIVTFEFTLENDEIVEGHIQYAFEDLTGEGEETGEIVNTGDQQESEFNFFINDVRYPISTGFVIDYGNFEDYGYNYDIQLFSRDPIGSDNQGMHYFYVELFSESTEQFVDGEYNFDGNYTSGTNHFGFSFANVNIEQNADNTFFIVGGQVNISTAEGVLEIYFELEDLYGNSVVGNYIGDYVLDKSGSDRIHKKQKFTKSKVKKMFK